MKYFTIDGTYVPKHCIYGPRPKEAVLFSNWEWYSVNETLFKGQREREVAAAIIAKEQQKKEASYNMTRNWQNTLTSIKSQSEQKRSERAEKMKQEKVDEYNRIIESWKESKKPIVDAARKVLFESKDEIKTMTTALVASSVLTEREKQIALKKLIKEEKKKKDALYAEEIKKDVEAYKKEQELEERKIREKKILCRNMLQEQIDKNAKRRVSTIEEEARNLKKMKMEMEKYEECERKNVIENKKWMRKFLEKGFSELQLEKTLKIEQEEEDVLNTMYNDFARRLAKAMADKQKKMIAEAIERRDRVSSVLAEQMMKTKAEDVIFSDMREKEATELKELKEKEEAKLKAKKEMELWRAENEENMKYKERMNKQKNIWEFMQNERRAELAALRKEELRRLDKERKRETREEYDKQIKEKKELTEAAEKLDNQFVAADKNENEKIVAYCDEVLKYARDRGWNEYPILVEMAKIKKKCGQESSNADDQFPPTKSTRPRGPSGYDCYCFKN